MELLIETASACLKFTVVETLNCHSSHTHSYDNSKSQHVSTPNGDCDNGILGICFSKMAGIDSAPNSPVTAKWSLFLGRPGTARLPLGDVTSTSPGVAKGNYHARPFSSIPGEKKVFMRESSVIWFILWLPLSDTLWGVWKYPVLLGLWLLVRAPLAEKKNLWK